MDKEFRVFMRLHQKRIRALIEYVRYVTDRSILYHQLDADAYP